MYAHAERDAHEGLGRAGTQCRSRSTGAVNVNGRVAGQATATPWCCDGKRGEERGRLMAVGCERNEAHQERDDGGPKRSGARCAGHPTSGHLPIRYY